MTNSVIQRIYAFNAGRDEALVKQKYAKMRVDVFSFYRGTCHLFYEDFPKYSPLNSAPSVWICGDLHLENYGSYKGDNRLVYFDINDFDEAVLAPCTWDLARFTTSIVVGSHVLQVDDEEATHLCNIYLDAYTNALATGQARTVEKETAKGLVKDLLESLKKRERTKFLDERTKEKKGQRRIVVDDKHATAATESQQERVKELIANWQESTGHDPEFFQVLDVQKRIAGTSSLGLERYVILIEGKGSPDKNYLLDLKKTQNSSLQPYLTVTQPSWESPAARVVAIQQRVQGTPPALLGIINDGENSYVLRELQPSQYRVSLKSADGKISRLEKLLQSMGQITAWDQLRSGGRQGSAIADRLIDFAHVSSWRDQVLQYAQEYAQKVEQDYQDFCEGK
ncbi:MAG TPA: DUF2252 domain-containing protein [Nostocaceae cyanobacterium]|nr:DUF2252 domain-containing protein [Nostocaceae cyanobacterium]